jgi:hypothetical protein
MEILRLGTPGDKEGDAQEDCGESGHWKQRLWM